MPTAQEWQQRVIEEAGGISSNTVFRFEFGYGTDGGTFSMAFNSFVTADIAYPCSSDTLAAALVSLAMVGADGCEVRGPIGGPFEIEMTGGNARQSVPPPFVDGSLLDPSQDVEVEVIEQGEASNYSNKVSQYWADHASARSEKLRYLLCCKDLLNHRIRKLADVAVDTLIGQLNQVERRESQRVSNLRDDLRRIEGEITSEIGSLNNAARRSYGGVMTATRETVQRNRLDRRIQ